MPITPTTDPKAKRLCKTCSHNNGDRWCDAYVDEVTGEFPDLYSARPSCNGDKWEAAAWKHIDTSPSVPADRIETPMATIYRDPPAKLYE